MDGTTRTEIKQPLALGQVVQDIDRSLRGAGNDLALQLGPAAMIGREASEQRDRYILLDIGEAHLAVPVPAVAEVGDLPAITRLPNVPAWVLGIINVRSEIVSVLDLTSFLGWKTGSAGSGRRMIILHRRGLKVGLRIDRIVGTHRRDEETEVSEANPLQMTDNARFLREGLVLDSRIYYVLDIETLLTSGRLLSLEG